MLFISSNNEINLTRGDTAYLKVGITNSGTGLEYTMKPSDTLTLTIRKSLKDSVITLQKVISGSNEFHILPSDTAGLEFRNYLYDVQLTMANGDVCTVIAPTTFTILSEVTY